jgi:hypothetical protein
VLIANAAVTAIRTTHIQWVPDPSELAGLAQERLRDHMKEVDRDG